MSASAVSIDDNEPYEIDGDSLSIGAGGLDATPDTAADGEDVASLELPVALTAPQTWDVDANAEGGGLAVASISGSAEPLTIDFDDGSFLELADANVGNVTLDGDGTVILADPAGGDTSSQGTPGQLNADGTGTVSIESESAGLIAPYAGARTGPLSVPDGTVSVGEGAAPDGTLEVKGAVNLGGDADLQFYIDQPGTTASTDYSQLDADDDVDLSDATLTLAQGFDDSGDCVDLNPGDVDTLISTQGQLTGTFDGVPNGSTVTIENDCDSSSGSATATINYTATSVTATIVAAGNAGDAAQNTTSLPSISGTLEAYDTVTASPGTWSGNPTFSYQWYACTSTGDCNPVIGATSVTYTIPDSQVGDTLAVAVTGTNAAGSNTAISDLTTAVQAAVVPPQLNNISAPTVSGADTEGDTLSTTTGDWSGDPTSYSYLWLRCAASGPDCTVIGGATSATYTLTAADVGYRIESSVAPHNGINTSDSVASAPTPLITVGITAPTASVPPALSSHAPIVGEKLDATAGTFTGTAPLSYTYAWELCPGRTASSCKVIAGATGRTYTPTSADAGDGLRFVVAARNSAGVAYGVSSITVAVIGAPQIRPGLKSLIARSDHDANISTFLKQGYYKLTFTGLAPGRLTLTWTAKVKRRQIIIGQAIITFTTAATKTIIVKLTTAGKILLKSKKTQLVTASVKFTLAGTPPITQTQTFTLKR